MAEPGLDWLGEAVTFVSPVLLFFTAKLYYKKAEAF